MGASLSLSISVTNTSDTAATVKVTLKVKSTSGSWNAGSQYGYITIDGTKYEFHHSFSANTTTTLATKSKSIARTTANKSVAIKGYYKTGVSPGNISKSSSTTVSARPKYNVTFNADGGTGTKTVAVFSGYTTTFPTTTKTGYTFVSWNGYAQGATTPAITSAKTYTASWAERTATLSYNANGYGTAPANVTMRYTVETKASSISDVANSGYHFINWNTDASGTGTSYTVNAVVKAANVVPSNTTLYAQWALNTYTIKLNLGEAADAGGSVDPTQLTKTHGVALSLPTPTWNRPFVGWSYNDSNIGSVCNVDGDVNLAEITLTALWSEEVRPVIYHYWDSATDINSTYQTYKIIGNTLTLLIPKVTNYVFKGWYTNSSFSGEPITTISNTYDYPTGDSRYQDPEPIHLYAKWNETYTIVYNINNPSYDDGITAVGNIISSTCENGGNFTLRNSSTYTYGDGQCTASGWSLNSGIDNTIDSINGQRLTDSNTITLSGYSAGYVLNLYAVWTSATYHVYLKPGDGASGNTIDISKQYYESYLLPSEVSSEWHWTPAQNHHLSNWLLNTTNIPLATTITVIGDITYKAAWVDSYHVPVIPAQTGIIAERYVDANYTSTNEGGKYIQISARGTHGSYDGKTVSIHTYNVDVAFYDTTEIDEATPIATHNFDLTSTTETFYQVWRKPLSDSGPNAQLLYDKKLNMLYCVLQIIDTTDYGESIAEAKRTFTYSFEIPLKRAIAMHMADDLSAIAMFEELQDKDAGLIINNNSIVINHLWAWKIDPVTKHMYLEWIGETANE